MEEVEGSTFPGADLALVAGDGGAGGYPIESGRQRLQVVSLGSGESGDWKGFHLPPDPLKSPVPASAVVLP